MPVMLRCQVQVAPALVEVLIQVGGSRHQRDSLGPQRRSGRAADPIGSHDILL
jgi:hypothetical protein